MNGDRLRRALLAQKQRLSSAQHSTPTAVSPPRQPRSASNQLPRSLISTSTQPARKRKRNEESPAPSAPPPPIAATRDAPPLTASKPQKRHKKARAADGSKKPSQLPPQPPAQRPSSTEKEASSTSALSSQLTSARFRWLNEKLYTSSSADAQSFFASNPSSFAAYHLGFRQQVDKWPQHPLSLITAHLAGLPRSDVADMGCGDAAIASAFHPSRHTVHSFDLLAASPLVTACNIAHTPLDDGAVDVVVYCLSLMGLDWMQFVREGWRVLRKGGEAVVAEVASRMKGGGGTDGFVRAIESVGFRKRKVVENDYFVCVWLTKVEHQGEKQESAAKGKRKLKAAAKPASEAEAFVLAPCLYKKR